jgi:Pentapeptide repeats (8 copies)
MIPAILGSIYGLIQRGTDFRAESEYDIAINWDGQQSLQGFNLSGKDMRGRSLNGADLRDANLGGANLSFARLSASNLAGATVRWNSQNTQAKLGSLTSCPGWVRGTGRKVGVDVFEAACRRQVVVGDWEAVGVRVVDGGGAGDHGFGRVPPFGFTGLAPTLGGGRDDGDELAQEVAFGAEVGGGQ